MFCFVSLLNSRSGGESGAGGEAFNGSKDEQGT